MRIFAISGSLRARSSNTELLRAAALVAPAGWTFDFYDGLAGLPHFNPDLDAEGSTPPEPVRELRARIAAADALLICSPEYAHGVAGSMKNALDWLVSDAAMVGKPVGLLNASARAVVAHAAARRDPADDVHGARAGRVDRGAARRPSPRRGRDRRRSGAGAALRGALDALAGSVEARSAR